MSGKGLDLLLVNAGGAKKRIYQELSEDYSAVEPPFWAALTAGFIRNKGYSVDVLDANAENLNVEESGRRIVDANPGLVNIVVYGQHPSASTQLMSSVGELCKEIKRTDHSERKIILTGLHPSALPERTLREEACDFVAQGEGFHTLLGLLQKRNLSEIPGLWRRDNGKIIGNLRAKNIENLTLEMGDVAWDLLSLDRGKYKAHNWQCLDDFSARSHYASLSTSLGCPFKCDFCSVHQTFGERKIRYWSSQWTIDQISTLTEKYGVKVFKIIDELFIFNPEHYMGIADGLIDRGLGKEINIWAYARVDTIKEKYLERLREAGFKWLCIGFESGNEKILKEVHKGNFTGEDMIKIRDRVKSFDINVLGNYMFGFPEDNIKTMQETLDLATEQNCEFANFYCATAWPGSQLYERVVASGHELPKSWGDYAQHAYGFHPLPPNEINSRKVLEFRDHAFHKYFENPRYLNMIENRFGLKAREHIENMTKIKLKRELFGD